MVIHVLDLVPHCHSWADGSVLGQAISSALRADTHVTVSFAGVDDIPSSFANAAFVRLLDDFEYDHIRRDVAVVDSTRQINNMIKNQLQFKARRLAA
jgi:hypothetical protein